MPGPFDDFLADCISDCVNSSSGKWQQQDEYRCLDCGKLLFRFPYHGGYCLECAPKPEADE